MKQQCFQTKWTHWFSSSHKSKSFWLYARRNKQYY